MLFIPIKACGVIFIAVASVTISHYNDNEDISDIRAHLENVYSRLVEVTMYDHWSCECRCSPSQSPWQSLTNERDDPRWWRLKLEC